MWRQGRNAWRCASGLVVATVAAQPFCQCGAILPAFAPECNAVRKLPCAAMRRRHRLPGAAATAHNCALWALRAHLPDRPPDEPKYRCRCCAGRRCCRRGWRLLAWPASHGCERRRPGSGGRRQGARGRRRDAGRDRRGREGRRGADAAGHHRRRQPALRRVGDAAPRSCGACQRDRIQGRPADRPGHHDGAARPGDQPGRGRAGEGEPVARQDEVRARDRLAEAGLHLEPGEGRGGKQPAARRGGDCARGSAPREDRDQGAVCGCRRPAFGVARRLREGGTGSRQPGIDRSA